MCGSFRLSGFSFLNPITSTFKLRVSAQVEESHYLKVGSSYDRVNGGSSRDNLEEIAKILDDQTTEWSQGEQDG